MAAYQVKKHKRRREKKKKSILSTEEAGFALISFPGRGDFNNIPEEKVGEKREAESERQCCKQSLGLIYQGGTMLLTKTFSD